MYICVANCGQTAADSDMVTMVTIDRTYQRPVGDAENKLPSLLQVVIEISCAGA